MGNFKSPFLLSPVNGYLVDSPQSSNFTRLLRFTFLLGFLSIVQIITAVVLMMYYNTTVLDAFNSVEHIMKDVNNGWFICYLHCNIALAFLFLVYLYIEMGLRHSPYKHCNPLHVYTHWLRSLLNKGHSSIEWFFNSPPMPCGLICLPVLSVFSTQEYLVAFVFLTDFVMNNPDIHTMSSVTGQLLTVMTGHQDVSLELIQNLTQATNVVSHVASDLGINHRDITFAPGSRIMGEIAVRALNLRYPWPTG